MPKIFEIFGCRVDDDSPEAESGRRAARCPFMGCDCDGGGNRYLSQIDFDDLQYSGELKDYFEGRESVPPGVCSGKTVWILQDVLADYISSSIALNLRRFRSDRTSEVNIMSLSYGDAHEAGHEGVAELTQGELFSGPARPPGSSSEQGFQDMIRAPIIPPKNVLLRSLALRRRVNTMNTP